MIPIVGHDQDNDNLTFSLSTLPLNGTLVLSNSSNPVLLGVKYNITRGVNFTAFTYIPYNGTFGLDSFLYEVSDNCLTSYSTYNITVQKDNPPKVFSSSSSTKMNQLVNLNLAVEDEYPSQLSVVIVSLPNHTIGELTLGNGSLIVLNQRYSIQDFFFFHPARFECCNTASFMYYVVDIEGQESNSVTQAITITGMFNI